MTARTGIYELKKQAMNITEAVHCHCAQHYELEIQTSSVPHECLHYADFEVIDSHMRRQRVPGPLLQARKRAWVRG